MYDNKYRRFIDTILEGFVIKDDDQSLNKTFLKLAEVENWRNTRVVKSGLLKGISTAKIKVAAVEINFQKGCTKLFKDINKTRRASLHVMYYCWSSDLIRTALTSEGIEDVNTYANELLYAGSVSTGKICKKVESPFDKVKLMREQKSGTRSDLSIYIGSQLEDLLCLLEADIGIVIGSDADLRSVGTHFGIKFVPIHAGVLEKQKEIYAGISTTWTRSPRLLYTVSSWNEISYFILGC